MYCSMARSTSAAPRPWSYCGVVPGQHNSEVPTVRRAVALSRAGHRRAHESLLARLPAALWLWPYCGHVYGAKLVRPNHISTVSRPWLDCRKLDQAKVSVENFVSVVLRAAVLSWVPAWCLDCQHSWPTTTALGPWPYRGDTGETFLSTKPGASTVLRPWSYRGACGNGTRSVRATVSMVSRSWPYYRTTGWSQPSRR